MTFPLIKNKTFAKAQAKQLYMDGEYFEKYYEESLKMKPITLIARSKRKYVLFTSRQLFGKYSRMLVTAGEKEKGLVKKSVQHIVEGNEQCESYIHPKYGTRFSSSKTGSIQSGIGRMD